MSATLEPRDQTAKIWGTSRKETGGLLTGHRAARDVEDPGKTNYNLGFFCGKKWYDSSTPSILAFLTESRAAVDTRLS
jgi:hypothetical protein